MKCLQREKLVCPWHQSTDLECMQRTSIQDCTMWGRWDKSTSPGALGSQLQERSINCRTIALNTNSHQGNCAFCSNHIIFRILFDAVAEMNLGFTFEKRVRNSVQTLELIQFNGRKPMKWIKLIQHKVYKMKSKYNHIIKCLKYAIVLTIN